MQSLDLDFKSVKLARAPLVLVIGQFRFAESPSLATRDGAVRLQSALSHEYIDVEEQSVEEVRLAFGPPGVALNQMSGRMFTLASPDVPWRINVSATAVTLLTTQYTQRQDFMSRAADLRRALVAVGVNAVKRVGVRSVSRVDDPDVMAELASYLRPELLGGLTLALPEGAGLVQSLSDIVVRLDEASATRLRAGVVPAGLVPDPVVEPLAGPSLLVDIDVWDDTFRNTDEDADGAIEACAHNQYQLFRWSVTDRFIEYFGGEQ